MDIGGIGIAVGVVLAIVGFFVGRAGGRSGGVGAGRTEGLEAGRQEARGEAERQIRGVVQEIARGRRPQGGGPGSIETELARALEAGWTPRDAERQQALREALGRVSAYLDQAVRAPLSGIGDHADAGELRERIDRALGSLQDMEFFLREPPKDTEGQDLAALVQQTTREFAQDQAVGVRVSLDGFPVRAKVNGTALMDALYLLLHNAARFGGGSTVDVTVVTQGPRAVLKVRDRGKGFTEEAFKRAFDPFYSTASDGLGLGLPHVRKVVEGMGGAIELRNVPDGGAEVELSFPSA
ncbi:MAG TPA: HAMP domain-containing sensor histidine kinase [Longimicrobiales bacterium]|nr:HAMP domain-containing sensor histidine kinase [Longimicrobiales bacterium]